MAEINDFIDPKAEQQVRTYINSLGEIVIKYNAIFDGAVKVNQQTNNVLKGQKSISEEQKKANELSKEAARLAKEQASAAAALDKQRSAALGIIAKEEYAQRAGNVAKKEAATKAKQLAAEMKALSAEGQKRTNLINQEVAKEKQLQQTLTMQVKTLKDAETQNKALNEAKKNVDITTKKGIQTVAEYNQKIDKNTKLIQNNASSDGKRTQGIGLYSQAIIKSTAIIAGVMMVWNKFSGFISDSIAKFDIQAKAVAQVNAVLRSTGGISGQTTESLKKQASELQKLTRIGDEMTLSGQAMLLTFTNVRGEIFEKSVPLMQDMATAMTTATGAEVTLKDTAILMGKALNDPIKGMTSLRRVGVAFTEQQTAQVRAMVKSGDIIGAQTIILTELQTEFGGSARAAALAGAGGLKQMENAWGDIKEVVGEFLISTINPFIQGLKEMIEPADTVAQSFKKQSDKVKDLTDDIEPLLKRYDALSDKSNLSKVEQSELKGIIDRVALAIPGAVTAFDEYGKAMGINTLKARGFINEQVAMMGVLNKKAIDDAKKSLTQLTAVIEGAKRGLDSVLKSGEITTSTGQSVNTRKATQQEIKDMQDKYTNLVQQRLGYETLIKELSGESLKNEITNADKENQINDRRIKTYEELTARISELIAVKKDAQVSGTSFSSEDQAELTDLENKQSAIDGDVKATQKAALDKQKINQDYQISIENSLIAGSEFAAKEYEKRASSMDKALEDELDAIAKAGEEEYQSLIAYNSAILTEQVSLANRIATAKVNILKRQLATGIISESEYNQKVFEINKASIQNTITGLKAVLATTKEGTARRQELETQLAEAQQDLDNITTDNFIENEKKKQEALMATLEKVKEVGVGVFSLVSALYDRQASKYEEAMARELSAKGITDEKKAEIEAKYARKVSETKRKQAIADKASALFQIALDTAIAVMKVTGQTGIGAVFAVPIVIALGALQAAAVLAKPIPKFKDGVKSAPRGIALVGEAGSELVSKNGNMQLIAEPSLINLSGGETIYKHSDTQKIMSATRPNHRTNDLQEVKQTIVESNEKLIATVKNKKELYISADGKKVVEKDGNYYTTYLNTKIGWQRN
jgi:hypothetical protein